MSKLVECVPNFSNGRSKEIIDAIAQAIAQSDGCFLLDVDPGPSTNRTVYTFVGSPAAVVEGALNAAREAHRLINMATHSGEHPRLGALDVCPFVPVRDVTMEECVQCAVSFGQQLASQLLVPVYLYGEAARHQHRRTLPSIRAGEYEGLQEKPGRLLKVQAMGWYLEEEDIAQVSTNLMDFKVTGLHNVYEEIRRDAKELKMPVIGSQLVGLVPLAAMLHTAQYYITRDKLFILTEEQKLRLVVSRLGLNLLAPFNVKERIIEYMVPGQEEAGLASLSLTGFVRSVGARTAAPGGGSVAAAVAAMGAALGSMVGLMSYGKRQFEVVDAVMRRVIPPLHHTAHQLLTMVDTDSRVFSNYMAALKLPKSTMEERARRNAAVQAGLKEAVNVPLALAETVTSLWSTLEELATCGNLACTSDLQVAVKALELGVFGAQCNVLTNLRDISDQQFNCQARERISQCLSEAGSCSARLLAVLAERMKADRPAM
ncbi:formimidoyltransferase-cyclodeaminase isoform X1 [Callorhinchus milii]|uniref:formimidoyltransferase-cyclodeaminase isoform X1 n=1 Tax=Callorhinchus milii TaxID=7868 RepID=UPI0004572399|nr:formimidoyltransferase-cyclodeaminase isoform X1 [Callorhinchus milii]|eukprot:gi/632980929/ref/XP_007907311.1/ PREDICTED: formimidoyltransferase-cyclodeaminase isoform X2 [Callorhinchus milii]